MEKRRLLISYAHPDDESFGLGAAIPKWIDDGVDVYLICATNGDVGFVPDALRGKFATVAELRLSELDCARQYLKFKDVFMLGYRDSGMPGSETTEHPDCLAYRWRHHPEGVAADVIEVMRRVRPQVVVTFNRYGGYGHPDHIAIQRATARVFERLRDEAAGKGGYSPQKLYYAAYPKWPMWMRVWKARLKGQDPRRMGINRDVDTLKSLEHIEPVHARISIAPYLDTWEKASRCHASQGGGRVTRTSRLLRRLLYGRQGFTRVYPIPNHSRVDEDDLFANVDLNGPSRQRGA
ncbi:MAG: GlcNAc-PI de-N-acetylase [Chloroflexi bacterium]|nr:PIG-L family deacetylase [Chloroflexota bacterium]MYE26332.1 GlcNAc-PI de-N-acetylase [Chloroflexota bacterium]